MKRRFGFMLILAAVIWPPAPRSALAQDISRSPVEAFILAGQANSEDQGAANLIPWPTSVTLRSNRLNLGPQSRIVAGDAQLRPLAEILAGEIRLLSGLQLSIARDRGAASDIVLQIDTALRGEAYVAATMEPLPWGRPRCFSC